METMMSEKLTEDMSADFTLELRRCALSNAVALGSEKDDEEIAALARTFARFLESGE